MEELIIKAFKLQDCWEIDTPNMILPSNTLEGKIQGNNFIYYKEVKVILIDGKYYYMKKE